MRKRQNEEGSALFVVLIALMVLLPLTLILAGMVLRWQHQSARFRDLTGLEYVARAGWSDAANRVAGRDVSLQPSEATSFELYDIGGYTARVRVSRDPDVVLTLNGQVLEGLEASKVDLKQTSLDPDMRRVRRFRLLEVYLVEVRVSARSSLESVRLRGILVRPDRGELSQTGMVLERGFFE